MLEDKFSTGKRKLSPAFLANYRRFMDVEVNNFPVPSNVLDHATSEVYNKDIAEIRISATRRNQRKRTRINNSNDDFEYDDENNDEE